MPSFPQDFLFGTATSAYQIEGAVREDGRGLSIWDTFSHHPATIHRDDTGDISCDHYHRATGDLDLMAGIGLGSYRFSIAWPRVMPDGLGPVNHRGLDFYKRILAGLHERGIAPMVTLYHWDLPQALQDRGGWCSRETASRFADFAAVIADELGDLVPMWVTVNEPWCASFEGHLRGTYAPGLKDLSTALKAAHHLLLAHGYACQTLRSGSGNGKVGIALNLTDVVPADSTSSFDVEAASRMDGYQNRWFLDPILRGRYPEDMLEWYGGRADLTFVGRADLPIIAEPLDFLGVNYYEHQRIAHALEEPVHEAIELHPENNVTDAGLAIEPAGLTRVLRRVHDEYWRAPIFVTENGACFHDYVGPDGRVNDQERISYLMGHLEATAEAIEAGVDVRGFYVWSLMDNFEWNEGYGARFGLFYVDYRTQERLPKASAAWFRDFIACDARTARSPVD